MKSIENSPEKYMGQLTQERRIAMQKLREIIKKNLPKGFEESMSYGMIGYVVPHSVYPSGYHCDSKLPLPFINIASQKHFIAVYHMGIYADPELLKWFINEFPKHCARKLDMGKSCIRFKNIEEIPYELIGQLSTKTTVNQWINTYETLLKKK
jgi:uncharacterized protein YdhG (YjbR/CyaY superfamily)